MMEKTSSTKRNHFLSSNVDWLYVNYFLHAEVSHDKTHSTSHSTTMNVFIRLVIVVEEAFGSVNRRSLIMSSITKITRRINKFMTVLWIVMRVLS